ncbi:MAG: heavy-metal-associated domain-containing protein [Betaproteobacteria bacterium]|nr:heavy-metal-associated domain-containing protein [Betaproteobacteria bacterium]
MTSSFIHRIAITLTLVIAAASASAQDAATSKISVNGMVCAFCAQGIEKRITAMPEAGPLYINLSRKLVAVQPKAGKSLDMEKIRREITDAGYEVTAVEMVPKTVAALREEYRARK